MAQVTIDLDEETASAMRRSADAAGVSMSAWLAELVRKETRQTWPDHVRALAGAWSDEEVGYAEDLRARSGEDTGRETL